MSYRELRNQLLDNVRPLTQLILMAGGTPYIVGGAVRDTLMDIPCKDVDIEVFGLQPDELYDLLAQYYVVNAVGRSFGVLKLRMMNGMDIDISIPRRDQKTGEGHKGFIAHFDPTMTVRDAAARRDYTINSLALGVDGTLYDFFEGEDDIKARILRHTSAAFSEDPLRVLRGMQLAARFKMTVATDTMLLCQQMVSQHKFLPVDRIWGEWKKFFIKGKWMSYGMNFLYDTNWINAYPLLSKMDGCRQEPEWHPEGDVLTHTCYVMDAMRDLCIDSDRYPDDIPYENDVMTMMLTALLHDCGKPDTTRIDGGVIRSPGHAERGAELAPSFLEQIGCPDHIQRRVIPLIREHMAHLSVEEPGNRVVRRLAARLHPSTMWEWRLIVEADQRGRPPLKGGLHPIAETMYNIACILQVDMQKPVAILTGRHLLAKGLKAGPIFRTILNEAYEVQLNGYIWDDNSADEWLTTYLAAMEERNGTGSTNTLV